MNRIARRCRIDLPKDKLVAFCEKHHIRKLSVLGSALRDDFRPDSDIDVLVKFRRGHAVGFITLHGIEEELSELIKRKVDLRTAGSLSPYFRDEVLRSAEVHYAED